MLSYTLAFGICLIVLQGVIAPPPPPPPAAGGAPPPPAPRGGAPPPPPPAARRPPPPVMAPRPAPVRPMPMAPQPTQPFFAVTAPIVTGPPSYSDCSCIFADFCPGNGYPKGECKDDGKEGTYCCY